VPKALIICLLSWACSLSAAGEGFNFFAADDSNIQYSGRWNFDQPAEPRVGWQGSTVRTRFTGTILLADIDTGDKTEYFRVIVDGQPRDHMLKLTPGRQTVELAGDLVAGQPHTVSLMKETYHGGDTVFYGFHTDSGRLLEPEPAAELKIAFFGDSNMEGWSLYSEKDEGGVGTFYAYPAVVSRMLGAEMHLQAVGGATLGGPGTNTVHSFIFSRERGQPDPDYRSGFQPDVIVVNAGANDISRYKGTDLKQEVKRRYHQVVADLRQVYGETPHIVLFNAYAWDDHEPANYSHEVVKEIGGNLSVLLFPWHWEQWHGCMVEHAGQARLLAAHIASLDRRFPIKADPEVFDGFGRNFDLANGSFEHIAADGFGAFGWRYSEDGVERIHDPAGAADGEYFIRLETGEMVHQGTDATGDFLPGGTSENQRYRVTAMIRSTGSPATAQIGADFEQQALYHRDDFQSENFEVTPEWTEYSAVFQAPPGTWKTYVTLKSAAGVVEFDRVRMASE
jgi:lysophospholipase L1-like esterase